MDTQNLFPNKPRHLRRILDFDTRALYETDSVVREPNLVWAFFIYFWIGSLCCPDIATTTGAVVSMMHHGALLHPYYLTLV